MLRPYEAVVVLDPRLEGQDGALDGLLARLQKVITDTGGVVRTVDRWGRRRLAYPIRHQLEGYYVLLEFDGATGTPQELERVLRITDGVLRHLVVRQVAPAGKGAAEKAEAAQAAGEEGPQANG